MHLLKKIFFCSVFLFFGFATQHAYASFTEIKKHVSNFTELRQQKDSHETKIKARVKELVLSQINGEQLNNNELDYCKKQLQLTPYGFDILINDYKQQAQLGEMAKNNASQQKN